MTDEPELGPSRLWRGMRALIFGDESETSLRDQIEDAIDEAETSPTIRGDLSPIERQMLRNLLQFGDRTAGEVAVPRRDIISVPQTLNFAELVAAFADAEHSRLPVTGDDLDDVIGMIHIKDVFGALANPGRQRTIEGLLRTPLFVPESMGVLDLLARMRTERIHLAIVVDEFGGTDGLITIEDVVEEIVGDIEDEHDEEATNSHLVPLEDGLWEADARTEIEEIAEKVDARLISAEDEVDTLGGLAFLLAGRILTPGESVEHPSGWRLESIEADAKRMIRLRLHAAGGSAQRHLMLFLIALITGALSALAFQPVGWAPLMVIAFAVLCDLLSRAARLSTALLIGWGFAVGQFVVGLNWIATAFTYQAAMPAWLGWLAVVLLSCYLAVFQLLATGLAWRLGQRRPVALVLALAGGWIVAEWLRAGMFTGFAWNPVGVTLVDTYLLSASGLIGTYGLSAIVVLTGGAIWLLKGGRLNPAAVILVTVSLLSLPLTPFETTHSTAEVRPLVRIVQPNIGQENRWQPGAAQAQLDKLQAMSGQIGVEPRLLLWPESAVTEPLEDDRPGAAGAIALQRQAVTQGLGPNEVLAAGSEGLASRDGVRVTSARNTTFVLASGGHWIGRYDKAHLVPYGEYLPMRPLLSAIGLSRLAPGDLDFDPGPGPRTIDLPGFGRMGVQLCYEIIFSGEVVDPRNRPDFIFNPSNDSWFGRWGPPQHLAQARLRAAEEGLPVLRATPTGVSAVVDADGKLLQSLPWRHAGIIDARLPTPHPSTPFARFGNLLPLLGALALLLAAGWLTRRR